MAPTRRCAFLTTDALGDYVTDDTLAIAPLQARGWAVDLVPWQAVVDWTPYEAVVIRSPWDYHQHLDAFLGVLATIDASPARLLNPLDTVRWNSSKTYLRDLAAAGVPVVPTMWLDAWSPDALPRLFDHFETDRLVVKPVVSASAEDTYPVHRDEQAGPLAGTLARVFASRAAMAQPFLDAIVQEGEFSVCYFGGAYSHTICKTPAPGDFRVQEEHGGHIQHVEPPLALRACADQVMQHLRPDLCYARIDLVRAAPSAFAVMEVELIEPSLYLRLDPAAPDRFATAFDTVMQRVTPR